MRQFLLILMPFLLAACDPMSVAVMGASTVASYSMTGKSPLDNAMSSASGKDCDLAKMDQREGEYCIANRIKQDPYFAYADNPRVYCFRTMGEIECHCAPDPYSNNSTPFVRGRGNLSPANMCSGTNMAMAAPAYKPSPAKQGDSLAPPPLPPEAYQEILTPAAQPAEKPAEPVTLAPEHYGS